ncbi:MAG: AAA family ATPase [Deltaproteobacteria bacterium]|nr:AAA family ATPase [Deltaproteobacteria bacterium]
MATAKTDKSEAKNKGKNDARGTRSTWDLVRRAIACECVRHVYLHGPPGIGKTHFAIHEGHRGAEPVYVVTLTQEMPASELRGHWTPRGSELVWMDGPVVRAMREGGLLVLNELLHASDDALSFLHPVLERPETASITLPTSETVGPAPGFRVIVTDNQPPTELPPALRDRFDVSFEIDEPHPSALAALSPLLREAARRAVALDEERRVSVRPFLVLDVLRHALGLEDACMAVFGRQRGTQIHDALLLAMAQQKLDL